MWRLLLLCLLCVSPVANAEIYKSVDESGKVIYTDNPHANKQADAVDLPPLNTQPPIKARPITRQAQESQGSPRQYHIQITSPADQTQVPPGQRDLTVTANLEPKLSSNHKIQFYLDGSPYGPASESTSVTLNEIYRGTHQIQADVVDQQGKTISHSEAVTVYVHRVSVSK